MNIILQQVKNWIRAAGLPAFYLHRLSGLGLAVYLYLHLAILFQLSRGESAWSGFLALMHSPWILILDGALLFGFVFHGLNGLRLFLTGWGYGLKIQRHLFWLSLVISLALTALGVLAIK